MRGKGDIVASATFNKTVLQARVEYFPYGFIAIFQPLLFFINCEKQEYQNSL
jgi:hypothetical protein